MSEPLSPKASTIARLASLYNRENGFFLLALGLTASSMILHLVASDEVSNDVASLYGPVVRELGELNWGRAFFHLNSPSVSLAAGMLAVLGFSPLTSLQIVSSGFFIGGLWPLRSIMRNVLTERQAGLACLLYAVTPRLIRYGGTGMIDSAKVFFLLLAAAALFAYARSFRKRYLAWLALAAAGLALSRGEGVLFAGFFGAWAIVLVRLHHNREPWRQFLPRILGHSALFVFLFLLPCLPQLLYIHSQTGYYALDSRQAFIIERIAARGNPAKVSTKNYYAHAGASDLQAKTIEDSYDVLDGKRNVKESIKGLHPVFLLLGLAGLTTLAVRRRITSCDVVFLSIIGYNLLIFAALGFITKRYIVPTVPFELSWVVTALTLVPLNRPRWRRTGIAVLAVLCLVLWVDGNKRVRDALRKPNPEREVGVWIAANRHRFISGDETRLDSTFVPIAYHNGRIPVIMAAAPHYAFWGQTDHVQLNTKCVYRYDQLLAEIRRNHVVLIVADADFHESCPEFSERWREDFDELEAALPDGVRLFRARPAAK